MTMDLSSIFPDTYIQESSPPAIPGPDNTIDVASFEALAPAAYNAAFDLHLDNPNDSPVERISDANNLPLVQRTYQTPITGANSQLRGIEIGFNARSVCIDNATGQWLWIPTLNQWVLPFHHGLIRNVIAGTQSFDLVAATPVGQSSSPQAGQYVSVTFYSVYKSPSDGVILPSSATLSATVNQGTPGASPWLVTFAALPPQQIQGLTKFVDLQVTNVVETLLGVAATLQALELINPNTANSYIQLFDTIGAVTLGTTVPDYYLLIPAGASAASFTNAGGRDINTPLRFNNGIKYAATTAPNNAVAPAAAITIAGGYY